MFKFLREFASESHADERRAGFFHVVLVGMYFVAGIFHIWCSLRHFKTSALADSKGEEPPWFI